MTTALTKHQNPTVYIHNSSKNVHGIKNLESCGQISSSLFSCPLPIPVLMHTMAIHLTWDSEVAPTSFFFSKFTDWCEFSTFSWTKINLYLFQNFLHKLARQLIAILQTLRTDELAWELSSWNLSLNMPLLIVTLYHSATFAASTMKRMESEY